MKGKAITLFLMTNILFLGELVGRCGIASLKTGLAGIKTKYSVDYTVINGEGMTNGYGIGKQHSMQLGKLGIDLTTGGEKMFYKPDFVEFLDHPKPLCFSEESGSYIFLFQFQYRSRLRS